MTNSIQKKQETSLKSCLNLSQAKESRTKLLLKYLEDYKTKFNSKFNTVISVSGIIDAMLAPSEDTLNYSEEKIAEFKLYISRAIKVCEFVLPAGYTSKDIYADDVATHILACIYGIKENQNKI